MEAVLTTGSRKAVCHSVPRLCATCSSRDGLCSPSQGDQAEAQLTAGRPLQVLGAHWQNGECALSARGSQAEAQSTAGCLLAGRDASFVNWPVGPSSMGTPRFTARPTHARIGAGCRASTCLCCLGTDVFSARDARGNTLPPCRFTVPVWARATSFFAQHTRGCQERVEALLTTAPSRPFNSVDAPALSATAQSSFLPAEPPWRCGNASRPVAPIFQRVCTIRQFFPRFGRGR